MLRNPIFIHGWGFSSKVFENFRGIKYEIPGHGKNRKKFKGFKEILKEIHSLTSSKHDVVGWSLGGSLALMLSYFYPHRVNRVIVIGTTKKFTDAWSKGNIRAMKMAVKKKGIDFFRNLAYGKYEDFFDYEEGMKVLNEYLKLDITQYLPHIKKEVYIVQGVDDLIVPFKEAFTLHNLLKNSKLFLLGGGHFPVKNEEHLNSILKGC